MLDDGRSGSGGRPLDDADHALTRRGTVDDTRGQMAGDQRSRYERPPALLEHEDGGGAHREGVQVALYVLGVSEAVDVVLGESRPPQHAEGELAQAVPDLRVVELEDRATDSRNAGPGRLRHVALRQRPEGVEVCGH